MFKYIIYIGNKTIAFPSFAVGFLEM